MDRLQSSQQSLQSEYDEYNTQSDSKLPPLQVSDSVSLSTLLELVTKRESVAQKRQIKPPKATTKLKAAIADVLLLQDGFDIKSKREANAKDRKKEENCT